MSPSANISLSLYLRAVSMSPSANISLSLYLWTVSMSPSANISLSLYLRAVSMSPSANISLSISELFPCRHLLISLSPSISELFPCHHLLLSLPLSQSCYHAAICYSELGNLEKAIQMNDLAMEFCVDADLRSLIKAQASDIEKGQGSHHPLCGLCFQHLWIFFPHTFRGVKEKKRRKWTKTVKLGQLTECFRSIQYLVNSSFDLCYTRNSVAFSLYFVLIPFGKQLLWLSC